MRKRSIIILCAAVVLAALAWVPASRVISWRHDYAEAEPLVQLVWPMASEIKQFSAENDRPPASIEEIARFSTRSDFSRLSGYRPKFTPSGERLFYLMANRRFSFEIDRSFTPKWANFTGVLEKPHARSGR
ncbi:MAG: hypothetical protein NTW03_04350 [Verrucomicrobia bacterium]|nr:hypothetical protein [Verrucomicrobiota bacterium]